MHVSNTTLEGVLNPTIKEWIETTHGFHLELLSLKEFEILLNHLLDCAGMKLEDIDFIRDPYKQNIANESREWTMRSPTTFSNRLNGLKNFGIDSVINQDGTKITFMWDNSKSPDASSIMNIIAVVPHWIHKDPNQYDTK